MRWRRRRFLLLFSLLLYPVKKCWISNEHRVRNLADEQKKNVFDTISIFGTRHMKAFVQYPQERHEGRALGKEGEKTRSTFSMYRSIETFDTTSNTVSRLHPASHLRYVAGRSGHGTVTVFIVAVAVDAAIVRAPPCSDQLLYGLAKALILCVRLLATRRKRYRDVMER